MKKRNNSSLFITLPSAKKPRAERMTHASYSHTTTMTTTATTTTVTCQSFGISNTNSKQTSRENIQITVISGEDCGQQSLSNSTMTAREMLQKGVELAQQRKLNEALAYLSRVVEIGVSQGVNFRSFTFFNRGLVLLEMCRFEEACVDFTFAIGLGCVDHVTFFTRGICHLKIRRYEQAIEDFTQALRLDPKDLEALANRGLAYAELKCYQNALDDYNTLLENRPTDASAYMNRSTVLTNMGRYEEALADAKRGMMLEYGNIHYQKKYNTLREMVENNLHTGWEEEDDSDILWV